MMLSKFIFFCWNELLWLVNHEKVHNLQKLPNIKVVTPKMKMYKKSQYHFTYIASQRTTLGKGKCILQWTKKCTKRIHFYIFFGCHRFQNEFSNYNFFVRIICCTFILIHYKKIQLKHLNQTQKIHIEKYLWILTFQKNIQRATFINNDILNKN